MSNKEKNTLSAEEIALRDDIAIDTANLTMKENKDITDEILIQNEYENFMLAKNHGVTSLGDNVISLVKWCYQSLDYNFQKITTYFESPSIFTNAKIQYENFAALITKTSDFIWLFFCLKRINVTNGVISINTNSYLTADFVINKATHRENVDIDTLIIDINNFAADTIAYFQARLPKTDKKIIAQRINAIAPKHYITFTTKGIIKRYIEQQQVFFTEQLIDLLKFYETQKNPDNIPIPILGPESFRTQIIKNAKDELNKYFFPQETDMILSFLYFVKRAIFSPKKNHNLKFPLLVFYGEPLTYKTTFCREILSLKCLATTETHQSIANIYAETDFRKFDDTQFYGLLSQKTIINFDELAFFSRKDNNLFKQIITANNVTYRPLFSSEYITVPLNCLYLGSSNSPIQNINHDSTNARRIFQIHVKKSLKPLISFMKTHLIDIIRCLSKDNTPYYKQSFREEILQIQNNDQRSLSQIEHWLEDFKNNNDNFNEYKNYEINELLIFINDFYNYMKWKPITKSKAGREISFLIEKKKVKKNRIETKNCYQIL